MTGTCRNLPFLFQTICVSSQIVTIVISYSLSKCSTGYKYIDIPVIFAFCSVISELLAIFYMFIDSITPDWFEYCVLAYFCCKVVCLFIQVCRTSFREMHNEQRIGLLRNNPYLEQVERTARIASNRSMLARYNERIGIHVWTDNGSKDNCPICQEPYNEGAILHIYECKHTCHVQCSMGWLIRKRECPLCREPINSAVEEV